MTEAILCDLAAVDRVRSWLVAVPREHAAIELARRLRAEGGSYGRITFALAETGRLPRTGGTWHLQQIARIVAPPRPVDVH